MLYKLALAVTICVCYFPPQILAESKIYACKQEEGDRYQIFQDKPCKTEQEVVLIMMLPPQDGTGLREAEYYLLNQYQAIRLSKVNSN